MEKQIGDKLVVDDQSPEEVMPFALDTINAAMSGSATLSTAPARTLRE